MAKKIYVTDRDIKLLKDLIKSTITPTDSSKRDIKKLKEELDRAQVVSSRDIPSGVITMNSKVSLIDIDNGKETVLRLVYPKDENIDKGRISILAPLGTALLGYSEGDSFEWEVPSGKRRRFKIIKVIFQPEAEGYYNL